MNPPCFDWPHIRLAVSLAAALVLIGCAPRVETQFARTEQSATNGERAELMNNGDAKSFTTIADLPTNLLDKYNTILDFDSPTWKSTVNEIGMNDSVIPYLFDYLFDEDRVPHELTESQSAVIASLRHNRRTPRLNGQETITALEIAAYADISCHFVEYPLRIGTLRLVEENANSPDVRTALHWIESSYQSSIEQTELQLRRQAMGIRMREYAKQILDANGR